MAAAAQQAQHAGVHGMNPWLETLGNLIREQPEPATLAEALAPLAALRDEHGQPKINVAAVRAACDRLLAAPEGAWHEEDWRRSHPAFPRK